MGTDPGVLSNHHLGTDNCTRANHHAGSELGFRVHRRRGVNLLRRRFLRHLAQSTKENINSPEQTRSPSTVASALTLPKRLRLRLTNSQRITS